MKSRCARSGKKAAAGIVAAAAMLLVAACSSDTGGGSSAAPTDSGGAITVWVDPPRVPAAEAFKKAHPDIDVTINQIDGTVGGKTLQQQFAQFLQQATGGNKQHPIVLYCLSPECWMSYNASLRAINLGYTNVLWYRGGIEAWKKAGLPVQKSSQ